jgi:hypothetical protein
LACSLRQHRSPDATCSTCSSTVCTRSRPSLSSPCSPSPTPVSRSRPMPSPCLMLAVWPPPSGSVCSSARCSASPVSQCSPAGCASAHSLRGSPPDTVGTGGPSRHRVHRLTVHRRPRLPPGGPYGCRQDWHHGRLPGRCAARHRDPLPRPPPPAFEPSRRRKGEYGPNTGTRSGVIDNSVAAPAVALVDPGSGLGSAKLA